MQFNSNSSFFSSIVKTCLNRVKKLFSQISAVSHGEAGKDRYTHVCVLVPLNDGKIAGGSNFKTSHHSPQHLISQCASVCMYVPKPEDGKGIKRTFDRR